MPDIHNFNQIFIAESFFNSREILSLTFEGGVAFKFRYFNYSMTAALNSIPIAIWSLSPIRGKCYQTISQSRRDSINCCKVLMELRRSSYMS